MSLVRVGTKAECLSTGLEPWQTIFQAQEVLGFELKTSEKGNPYLICEGESSNFSTLVKSLYSGGTQEFRETYFEEDEDGDIFFISDNTEPFSVSRSTSGKFTKITADIVEEEEEEEVVEEEVVEVVAKPKTRKSRK